MVGASFGWWRGIGPPGDRAAGEEAMHDPRWTQFDRYTEETFQGSDPVLERTLAAGRAAGLPQIQVAPNQGRFLHILARAVRAERILEIGTLAGYSTLWLGRALGPQGRLITLELDEGHAEVARANLASAGLSNRVEVRLGPALASLQRILEAGEGPFDLVFIDADKPNYPGYARVALDLTRPGGVIVIDNVVRGGAVAVSDDPDPNVRGVREMNAVLAQDPRALVTTLQTVGVKGHDGMTFVLVNDRAPSPSGAPGEAHSRTSAPGPSVPPDRGAPQRRPRERP